MSSRARWSVLALLAVLPALFPNVAGAKPPTRHAKKPTAKLGPAPQRKPMSMSIGSPTEGKLVNGVRLQTTEYLRIVPVYVPGDARWGLEALVGLIDRAARSVRKSFPDAVLSVGHLSKQGGGDLDRHASHESGRDADIGFYIKNHLGKPVYADHFVAFNGDGTAPSWPGARFDDARNWALVAALVGDGNVRISHIFVAAPLRQRLLAYAQKIGAPPNIRNRAAELMHQPRGALPHDDHFHVRIGCPSRMEGCIELPTRRRQATPSAHASHGPPPKPAPKPAAPAPHAAPPAPKPPPPPPPKESDETSFVPSLAPIVPGLDTAVIPAPLSVKKPLDSSRPAPQPVPPAVDDPDGILESR